MKLTTGQTVTTLKTIPVAICRRKRRGKASPTKFVVTNALLDGRAEGTTELREGAVLTFSHRTASRTYCTDFYFMTEAGTMVDFNVLDLEGLVVPTGDPATVTRRDS